MAISNRPSTLSEVLYVLLRSCERVNWRKGTSEGLQGVPHKPRTAFPLVIALCAAPISVSFLLSFSRLHSANSLPFRLVEVVDLVERCSSAAATLASIVLSCAVFVDLPMPCIC